MYIDEFHKQHTENEGLPGRLETHAGSRMPQVWDIPGTSFADGPAGL